MYPSRTSRAEDIHEIDHNVEKSNETRLRNLEPVTTVEEKMKLTTALDQIAIVRKSHSLFEGIAWEGIAVAASFEHASLALRGLGVQAKDLLYIIEKSKVGHSFPNLQHL
jgi:hypothetical protein